MKISNKRNAISQSMDLFIIIAAVLAVGGIVAAAVFSLGGSATQQSSIQVTYISAQGSSTGVQLNSFIITIKNNGATAISGTMTVTLLGTKQPATPVTSPSPSAAVSTGSTAGIWTTAGSASVVFNGASVTLQPGGSVTVTFTGPFGSALTTGWAPGVQQSVNVLFGTAAQAVSVTS